MRWGQPNKKQIQCWRTWEQDNLLEKKQQLDLTMVKISTLATLIMRLRYHHRKQIKIDYKAQFSADLTLNDKIEIQFNWKNTKKIKLLESIQVNLLNTIFRSWDQNNLIKNKYNKSWSLFLN